MNTSKIEKIKKLLTTAASGSGATKAEAETAMLLAQKLMDSEGVSMEDVAGLSMDDELGELGHEWLYEDGKQFYNWKKVLISNLAYFFDCQLVRCSCGTRKDKFDIVGRESNRITCKMFYNWIHDRTMKEAKELYGSQTAKRNSYCVGVANGLADKIHEIKPREKTLKSNVWGIVPIDEVTKYMAKIYPHLTKGKGYKTTASDRAAYRSGIVVGMDTSLNNQFGLKMISA